MKKVIIGLLSTVIIISLTGCGNDNKTKTSTSKKDNNKSDVKVNYNTKTCTSLNDSVTNKTTAIIEYDNNNEIKKITNVLEIKNESEELVKAFVDIFEKSYNGLNGVTSNYENLKWTQVFDFSKLSIDDYKKGKIAYMNGTFNLKPEDIDFSYIVDNKITVDNYVQNELSNYTCK